MRGLCFVRFYIQTPAFVYIEFTNFPCVHALTHAIVLQSFETLHHKANYFPLKKLIEIFNFRLTSRFMYLRIRHLNRLIYYTQKYLKLFLNPYRGKTLLDSLSL